MHRGRTVLATDCVVEDIDAAIEFFIELGLTLEGRRPIEGYPWMVA